MTTHDRIKELLQKYRIILFMKGNRVFPQCGFSAAVIEILETYDIDYETVNILEDPDLRQGLKDYSQWPTFPQLYIDQELIGGCDIVTTMHQNKELAQLLQSQEV